MIHSFMNYFLIEKFHFALNDILNERIDNTRKFYSNDSFRKFEIDSERIMIEILYR